jgi:hypothetical protein
MPSASSVWISAPARLMMVIEAAPSTLLKSSAWPPAESIVP